MKYYFGKVDEDNLDGSEFEHNGNFYYYMLELDEDVITIKDTCNHYMPIDLDAVATLAQIFQNVTVYERAKKSFDSLGLRILLNGVQSST